MENCVTEKNRFPIEILMTLADHVEIVHHIPGRIRLRILPSGFHLAKNLNAESLVRAIRGIKNAKVKSAARSVVIEYDVQQIPGRFWEDLAKAGKNPESRNSVAAELSRLAG